MKPTDDNLICIDDIKKDIKKFETLDWSNVDLNVFIDNVIEFIKFLENDNNKDLTRFQNLYTKTMRELKRKNSLIEDISSLLEKHYKL